jgi:hypothetical protein
VASAARRKTAVIQSYSGSSHYQSVVAARTGDLLVAVFCRVGHRPVEHLALPDTASHWCVLPPEVSSGLELDSDAPSDTFLLTRFGRISGYLIRLPATLVAAEGQDVEIEATWFVSPDWPGPLVLGWKGCLERMRFGFDPGSESFFFAEL